MGTLNIRAALVLTATLATLAAAPVYEVLAENPEDCRRQCSLHLQECQNGCLDSRDFDSCQDDCHDIEGTCLASCW